MSNLLLDTAKITSELTTNLIEYGLLAQTRTTNNGGMLTTRQWKSIERDIQRTKFFIAELERHHINNNGG